MGRNLAKTPLMAIIFAAWMRFIMVFLPFSEQYTETMHNFHMPVLGYIFLILYGLLVSIIIAVTLGAMQSPSIVDALMLFLSMTGLLWLLPTAPVFWFGDYSGILTRSDLFLLMGAGILCTLLLIVLAMLLFKRANTDAEAGEMIKDSFKIKVFPGLVVKIIGLPVLYTLMQLTCWYFFSWRAENVRTFYGNPFGDDGFVPSVVMLLLSNGSVIFYCLIIGLLYLLFSFPLMTRLQDKRPIFIAVTVLMFLSPVVLRLIPTPLLPDDVRIKLLVHDAVLFGVYGILSSILLHLSYKREEAPQKANSSASQGDNSAKPSAKGSPAKTQAKVLRATMDGKA